MRLRNGLVVLAVMSTMLWGAAASAQDGGSGWHGRHGHGGILRTVGLTDDQKQQIHQIVASHRTQLRTLGGQLRTASHQLKEKLYSPTPPAAADLASIGQLRDQLAQERLQMALQIRSVLTPAQLAKAAQTMQQMDQLRAQMRSLRNAAP